ncbi:hypothetical protein KJ664_01510 [Patescibacteria group bacterium]|nr:hypothetical protein [Patescibacteria group bacterium]
MQREISGKSELDFLKDTDLKRTIEDSIQYIQIIFKLAKNSKSNLYKEETYRVIVLYVVSIIEAVLLYILNTRNEKINYIDYKHTSPISEKFKHVDLPDDTVVIAVQKQLTKNNKNIGFVELVDFMRRNDLIAEKFAQEILDLNNIRNTFHFTKPRNKITCEIEVIEKAFELLLKVIENAPVAILTHPPRE